MRGCVQFFGVNFLLFSELPISSSADNSSFLLTFPTSCSPACSIQNLPAFALACFALACWSKIVYIYIFFFLVYGPCQGDYGLYSVLLPSFILFISLNKYVNTGIGTCCLPSWCSFIIKYAGCNPASLPNSLMGSGPAQGVYAEGVCELSLWLHHNLNYSTALRNAFHLFDRCHTHGESLLLRS